MNSPLSETYTAATHTIDADNKNNPINNAKAINKPSFIFSSLFIFGIYDHYIVNKILFFNSVIVLSLTIQRTSKVNNSDNNVEYSISEIVHITSSNMNFHNNQEYGT